MLWMNVLRYVCKTSYINYVTIMAVYNFVLILLLIYRFSTTRVVSFTVPFVPGDPFGLLCLPKSYEFASTWRLVCVNKHPLSLGMFLLLCGDIKLNPGDVTVCPCCSKPVLDSDRAMCCDLCNLWIHVSCDPAISVAEYDALVSCPSEMPWHCSSCRCMDSKAFVDFD